MKLIDYMMLCDDGHSEFSDTVYEIVIGCDFLGNGKDVYPRMCAALYRRVEIKKIYNGIYANGTADFTGFIRKNRERMARFVRDNWIDEKQYVLDDGNDDEFEYEWCKEFDNYLAGRYGETNNGELLKLLEECE